jgi:hypothetical protein
MLVAHKMTTVIMPMIKAAMWAIDVWPRHRRYITPRKHLRINWSSVRVGWIRSIIRSAIAS